MATIVIKIPPDWAPPLRGVPVRKVELPPTSEECRKVKREVHEANLHCEIVKVEKIENVQLYRAYQVNKRSMMEKNGVQIENETVAYHGSSAQAIESIIKNGFNKNRCKAGSSLGTAVYVTRKPGYAARAKYTALTGERKILRCTALTGVSTIGHPGLLEAPATPQNRDVLYDSVYKQADPDIFAIFCEANVYPTHVLTLMR